MLIGTVGALLLIPRLADVHGRYRIMFLNNFICAFAIAVIMTSDNYNLLILAMFILGASSVAKLQVATLYLYESLTKANYQKVFTVFAALEGALNVFTAIYFQYLSKDWIWLGVAALSLQTIGSIAFSFFTEAPRYLVKSGQMGRAQKVFEQIASVNGVDKEVASHDNVQELLCGKTYTTETESANTQQFTLE